MSYWKCDQCGHQISDYWSKSLHARFCSAPVNTAKYRAHYLEYVGLVGDEVAARDTIGVRGADLTKLLDAYERLQDLLK